jgi:hypothetical protein
MCRKWRRLPLSIRAASLPESWTCERGMWGYRDTATAAFTPLSCIVPEPSSSGDDEVAPEEGAPDVALLEGRFWIFAYGAVDAARRAAATPVQQPAAAAAVPVAAVVPVAALAAVPHTGVKQEPLALAQQVGQPG